MYTISETTPQERAADLIYKMLVADFRPTAQEVAQLYGIGERAAQYTLSSLSRSLPLYRDDDTGRWGFVSDEPPISLY